MLPECLVVLKAIVDFNRGLKFLDPSGTYLFWFQFGALPGLHKN
jgi:hypothetical protein